MLTPEQIESKLDRILLKVQKPGRYVGGELHTTIKDWDTVKTKVALIFPDLYDLGISNVGLKILYDQVNQRDDALAERAYAPWVDMEAQMRENGIPLYALEFETTPGLLRHHRLLPALRNALHQYAQRPGSGRYPRQIRGQGQLTPHHHRRRTFHPQPRTHACLYRRVCDRRGRGSHSRYY